jgi:hypothetical protein
VQDLLACHLFHRMISHMEIARRTWTAAIKLAVVVSLLAATAAFVVSRIGDVPRVAVVMPVIVVAFAASWVQTQRISRQAIDDTVIFSARSARSAA